jgi:hypothetical protein
MPEKETIRRAKQDKAEGKAPTTQAGEFIREEIHHVREGKHGARSAKQAIAIGLSKARRAGVKLPPPRKGTVSAKTRKSAASDAKKGQAHPRKKPAANRSKATLGALKREGKKAVSHAALSRHAESVARQRTPAQRKAIAKKAVNSRTPAQRRASARKGARTRARHQVSKA